MKKIIILIILAGLLIAPALAQNPPQDKNWEVVFQDDFNTFNTQRWIVLLGPDNYGEGRDEGVPFHTYENTFLENGKLVLRTLKENHVCQSGNCKYPNQIHPYTTGAIDALITSHYGYYEMYAKLPSINGFSPGFWFHGSGKNSIDGCWYNEINVIEVNTCWRDAYEVAMHAKHHPNCDSLDNGGLYNTINHIYGNAYHWFGLEWDRDKIIWYFDRKMVKQMSNNYDAIGVQYPMIMKIGIGLYDGPATQTSCPVPSNTQFPVDMFVDQVNAYRLKCDKNIVVNEIINYNTFSYAVKKSISLSSLSSLSSGKNVTLRATDFIELKSGFEVPLGAELYLDINPCE